MQQIDLTCQVLYSELAQRSLDAAFTSEFDTSGRFISMESRGRRYWYFDTAKEDGGKRRQYVGPVDDPEITKRVENFKTLKAGIRTRRRIVSTLIREAHLPRPETKVGNIIGAIAEAGFFRLRGVLIGTVAFQAYSALLGTRLPNAAMQTGDADFAQFHSISVAVEDEIPPVLELLRELDPTFREIPDHYDGKHITQFADRSGYKVEFLTPNVGSDEQGDRPAPMPALGGASAQPLRLLDYLIHLPVRAVILHGAGIPVLVPAPERYAVHKLIVATRRRTDNSGADKSAKDVVQAQIIMEAMLAQRQGEALADVYAEAWDRGPHWRDALATGLKLCDPDSAKRIRSGLVDGISRLEMKPVDYGL